MWCFSVFFCSPEDNCSRSNPPLRAGYCRYRSDPSWLSAPLVKSGRQLQKSSSAPWSLPCRAAREPSRGPSDNHLGRMHRGFVRARVGVSRQEGAPLNAEPPRGKDLHRFKGAALGSAAAQGGGFQGQWWTGNISWGRTTGKALMHTVYIYI